MSFSQHSFWEPNKKESDLDFINIVNIFANIINKRVSHCHFSAP